MKTINLLFKSFAAISMALAFSAGAGFAVGCNPDNNENEELNPSEKPEPDDNPQPEEPIVKLEDVVKEYNGVVTKVKSANSLTIDSDVIGKVGVIKLDGAKVGLTTADGTNYYETAEDKTFEYSLQNDGWHKALSDGEITAKSVKTSMSTYLDKITWKSFNDDKVLSGEIILGETALSKAPITASYDTKANTLTYTSTNQTVKIYDVDKTLVTLPQVTVDETQQKPPVEEFKITKEVAEKIQENLGKHLNYITEIDGIGSEINKLYTLYLTKSSSDIIDTIGVVMSINSAYGGETFAYRELTLATATDLNFQSIYKNGIEFSPRNLKINNIFSMNIANQNYSTMVETLMKQTFGENYKESEWYGWRGSMGESIDSHKVVIFKNNKIYETSYGIYNNGQTLGMAEAVEKNFNGKQPSSSTFFVSLEKIYDIDNEKHILLVVDTPETEQDL